MNRVSLGVQSFHRHLLAVLERRAAPDDVRRAFYALRDAGFDNISLDLIYGIPGQSAADLERDLDEALALAPEHLSCYELEAKPGTRFTHTRGDELLRQAEAMEGYFERVVETLTGAGYRWYETANFCRPTEAGGRARPSRPAQPRVLARPRLPRRSGSARSPRSAAAAGGTRRASARYVAALGRGERPPRELEPLGDDVKRRERLMLGLRLDEPLPLAGVEQALDAAALARLERLGLAERRGEALRADGARPLPRRGGHGRTACLGGIRRGRRPGYDCPAKRGDPADPAAGGDPPARRRGVRRHGQPVGSKTLVERTIVEVSSSTVRSELAELEALGLLTHPHTSAGRVPTERGYRVLRGRAARPSASRGPARSRSTCRRCAARSRPRSRRRRRCSRR